MIVPRARSNSYIIQSQIHIRSIQIVDRAIKQHSPTVYNLPINPLDIGTSRKRDDGPSTKTIKKRRLRKLGGLSSEHLGFEMLHKERVKDERIGSRGTDAGLV